MNNSNQLKIYDNITLYFHWQCKTPLWKINNVKPLQFHYRYKKKWSDMDNGLI